MFVFAEDHPDSIDDGGFETTIEAADKTWWELPTDRHSQGATFSMADGHVERHRWNWPKKFTAYYQPVAGNSGNADLSDLRWVQNHLPADRQGKYPW